MQESYEETYKKIEKLTSLARGFQPAVVLTTAAEYELFELLAEGPLSPEQVAAAKGLDARATGIVLHALAGMRLLEKEPDGRFTLSELAAELLVRGKPWYQGDIIRHTGHLIERWAQLPQVLKTGRPGAGGCPQDDKRQRRDFILGMSNNARLSAAKVGALLDLGGVRRMLDLGGGPGTYAISFCEQVPGMRATVFDLPAVIDEVTREQVELAGMSDRIDFRRGSYLNDDYGSGYDLVFISNIIHSLDEAGCRELVRRSREALVPGGRLIVKDFLLDEDMVDPPFSSLFAVNMLVGTEGGRCYSLDEVRHWLSELGFGDGVTVAELTPQARMVIGIRRD